LIVVSVALALAVGCTGSPPPEPTRPAPTAPPQATATPAPPAATGPQAVETAAAAAAKVAETAVAGAPPVAQTAVAGAPKAAETAVAGAPKAAATAAAAAPTIMAIPGLPGIARTAVASAGQEVLGELGAEAFLAALRLGGVPIADTETYSAESDPEKLLGRPNQYVARAAWRDTRINVSPPPGKKPEPGIASGGIVEIFANERDRETRQTMLAQAATQPPPGQHLYGKGRVLVRVSRELTPAQAADYERVLADFVG
jgi:hypothetical protein